MVVYYPAKKNYIRDFPAGPVVGILPSNTMGEGSISSLGARIPHVSWPRHEGIKEKKKRQCCSKFNGDFKDGPHQKNLLK